MGITPKVSRISEFRFSVLPSVLVFFSCFFLGMPEGRSENVQGIILMIADGVSIDAITATRLFDQGVEGRLALEDMPQSAFVRTHSLQNMVTDSAAAATAMARGVKAMNGITGCASLEAAEIPVSLLDIAKKAGWTTAVVTTDNVTAGTPGPFLAERVVRSNESAIASQILAGMGSRVDIVLGGGAKWFAPPAPKHEVTPEVAELMKKNAEVLGQAKWACFRDWEKFIGEKFTAETGPVLGIFSGNALERTGSRKPAEMTLQALSEKALQYVQAQGKPFLIVIEEALTDGCSHNNNARQLCIELREFDRALAWLRKNAGDNTLIVTTTDHGTSGLVLGDGISYKASGDTIFGISDWFKNPSLTWGSGPGVEADAKNFLTNQPSAIKYPNGTHTGGAVWLYACGPNSENFRGTLDNTDIYKLLVKAISGF